jgi:type I restriction enzyme S subunit
MSSEWNRFTFEVAPVSILDGDRGTNYPSQDDFLSAGHCLFLNTGNVTPGGFDFSNCAFISEEKDNVLRKGKLVRGDIVLTTRGTVGNVGLFNERIPFDHVRINSGMVILRPEQETLSSYFLYLFLRSDLFKEQANSLRSGSAQPQLPIRDLKCVEITVPPIKDQNKICSFLGALDDRITLLRETNTTLEAIAQALFKSWFVDFDPVRAKQEGREPEGMDADTAALFPDSFEESELGLVPRGWNQVPFTDTVSVIGGGTPKTKVSEYWNGDIPWFSVVDAPASTDVFVIDTQKHITEKGLNSSSTKLLEKGTTIISARGTVGRLALVGRQMAMNQSCYGLRGKAEDVYFTYFSTHRLIESLKQRSHGSVFDTITTETMKGVFVIYPGKAVVQSFETLLQPVMERIHKNLDQAQTVATLRDTLLPRLISGQLRLPDEVCRLG